MSDVDFLEASENVGKREEGCPYCGAPLIQKDGPLDNPKYTCSQCSAY